MQKKEEIWKEVYGFEGLYVISNLFRIKKLKVTVKYTDGRIFNYPERIVEFNLSGTGYKRACLTKNKKTYKRDVHRIFAVAFIPNPLNLPEVNHKNGIKTDNRIENLEWVTCAENLKHALDTGLRRKVRSHKVSTCKINEYKVLAIRRLYKINPKFNRSYVARKLGVTYDAILDIIKNKSWKNSHNLDQVKINQLN
mgnify:CR=1 FL=1